MGLDQCPLLLSRCKVQIRHYLLGLLYVLENTLPPPFPNANYKCDIIYWGYLLLYREYPPFFQNAKHECDIIYWGYLLFIENTSSFSKCKLQMRHYLFGLFHGFENTPFSKYKEKICHYLLGLLYALDNTPISKG